MTEQEYRTAEGVNKSLLWYMHKSPAHYKYFCEHEREDTQAFKLGRAIHAAVLTPTAYKRGYTVLPEGIDRRTKAGKEAYEEFLITSAGKEIISADDAAMINQVAAAVRTDQGAMELLKGSIRERPLFWKDEETGLRCKCRVDAYNTKRGLMLDLKTTTDAATNPFIREALRFGYDVQAAHYMAGYFDRYGSIPEWYFIAVEKSPPYAVNVLRAEDDFISHGEFIRAELLRKVKNCQESGCWPGYGVNGLSLPFWASEE